MTTPATQVAPATAPLVNVFPGQIGGIAVQVCDARELHAVLDNLRQFADWIKDRIEFYDFIENQDFAIASQNREAKRGGHNRKDYHLTLDMAKELCMVENNPQGRAARRYFIACEREAKQQAKKAAPALPSPEQQQSERKRQSRINQRAWQLAHLAYEAYRDEMQTCDFIKRGVLTIETWQPRCLARELVDQAEQMAESAEIYSRFYRRMAQSLRRLTGTES